MINAIINSSDLFIIIEDINSKIIIGKKSFNLFRPIPKLKFYQNKLTKNILDSEIEELVKIKHYFKKEPISNPLEIKNKIILLENKDFPYDKNFFSSLFPNEETSDLFLVCGNNEKCFYYDSEGNFYRINNDIKIDDIISINEIEANVLIRITNVQKINVNRCIPIHNNTTEKV